MALSRFRRDVVAEELAIDDDHALADALFKESLLGLIQLSWSALLKLESGSFSSSGEPNIKTFQSMSARLQCTRRNMSKRLMSRLRNTTNESLSATCSQTPTRSATCRSFFPAPGLAAKIVTP